MIDWPNTSENELTTVTQARESFQAFRERRKRPRVNTPANPLSEDLRPIPFENASATPLPDTVESSTEFAWLEFDAAQVQIDLSTDAGRRQYAELRGIRLVNLEKINSF